MLQQASEAVAALLAEDSELEMEEHRNLHRYMEEYMTDQRNQMNL